MIALVAGTLLLAAAWVGLAPVAGHRFAAHMAMHVTVVALAAPLLATWLAHQPPRRWWWRRLLAMPAVASAVEFVAIWGWHLPAAHDFARMNAAGLVLEQASFLFAALWLWTAALARPAHREDPAGAGVLALLLTSMHMILLGTLLTLAPRSLYRHATDLDDLHAGGVIMLAGGGLPYLVGGLSLVWRLMDRRVQSPAARPTVRR